MASRSHEKEVGCVPLAGHSRPASVYRTNTVKKCSVDESGTGHTSVKKCSVDESRTCHTLRDAWNQKTSRTFTPVSEALAALTGQLARNTTSLSLATSTNSQIIRVFGHVMTPLCNRTFSLSLSPSFVLTLSLALSLSPGLPQKQPGNRDWIEARH